MHARTHAHTHTHTTMSAMSHSPQMGLTKKNEPVKGSKTQYMYVHKTFICTGVYCTAIGKFLTSQFHVLMNQ